MRPFRFEHVAPGHYYSALPSRSDIKKYTNILFNKQTPLPGIKLNTEQQLERLVIFSNMHEDPPFFKRKQDGRFDPENDTFSYDDAPVLHYMLRQIQPARIIEIGCGHSSACMLDTCEQYLDERTKFTFIDVDCKNLRSVLKESDILKCNILEKPIQEVDLGIFKSLLANDLLFIDSSHVIKTGSDLNTIYFKILPLLNSGVYIHIHDIRYPFQYFNSTIGKRIYWNEAYLLHAFLIYNNSFQIAFWLNSLLNSDEVNLEPYHECLHLAKWDDRFNRGRGDYQDAGGSIYIQKI